MTVIAGFLRFFGFLRRFLKLKRLRYRSRRLVAVFMKRRVREGRPLPAPRSPIGIHESPGSGATATRELDSQRRLKVQNFKTNFSSYRFFAEISGSQRYQVLVTASRTGSEIRCVMRDFAQSLSACAHAPLVL